MYSIALCFMIVQYYNVCALLWSAWCGECDACDGMPAMECLRWDACDGMAVMGWLRWREMGWYSIWLGSMQGPTKYSRPLRCPLIGRAPACRSLSIVHNLLINHSPHVADNLRPRISLCFLRQSISEYRNHHSNWTATIHFLWIWTGIFRVLEYSWYIIYLNIRYKLINKWHT